MSAIAGALRQINMEIPQEVLQLAFLPRRYDPSRRMKFIDGQLPVSIDAMITDQVIQGFVGPQINRSGGQDIDIPLRDVPYERIDHWNAIWRIPDSLTGQRTIIAFKKITYGNSIYGNAKEECASGGNLLTQATKGLMAVHQKPGRIGTAEASLVAHNTVQVTDSNRITYDMVLTCTVTHNNNFSDIPPGSLHRFDELCVLATKAYIYTKLNINLDEGAINSGATNGRIREVVDEYRDAIREYKDYWRDEYRPAAFINNRKQWKKTMAYAVGGRR